MTSRRFALRSSSDSPCECAPGGYTSSIPAMRDDAEPLLANAFDGGDLFAIRLADS